MEGVHRYARTGSQLGSVVISLFRWFIFQLFAEPPVCKCLHGLRSQAAANAPVAGVLAQSSALATVCEEGGKSEE